MKAKKTKKYKTTIKRGGLLGFDPNKMIIDGVLKTVVGRELKSEGLSDEQADLAFSKAMNTPKIKEEIAKVNKKATNIEDKMATQGRHNIIGAIPLEIGEIANIGIDSAIDVVKVGEEGKDIYNVVNEMEGELNISNSSTNKFKNLQSNMSASAKKLQGNMSASAKKLQGKTNGKKGGTKKKHKRNKKTRKYKKKLFRKY